MSRKVQAPKEVRHYEWKNYEVLHLYLARGLTFGDTHPDEDEFLSVRRIPFQELVQRCLSGEIQDGKTVTAVLKAKLLLGL